jgi:acrylyl-CoA reductase (NADPH)
MASSFRAIRLFKTESGPVARIVELSDADLIDGDVDVRIEYPTLNYKDGLAAAPALCFH